MKFKLVSKSTAEGSEYEGEFLGRKVRITRLTDPNSDGGRPETRWDGFVWENDSWSLVAECYPRMTDAVYVTQKWIREHPA